jgi:hypothetical protein
MPFLRGGGPQSFRADSSRPSGRHGAGAVRERAGRARRADRGRRGIPRPSFQTPSTTTLEPTIDLTAKLQLAWRARRARPPVIPSGTRKAGDPALHARSPAFRLAISPKGSPSARRAGLGGTEARSPWIGSQVPALCRRVTGGGNPTATRRIAEASRAASPLPVPDTAVTRSTTSAPHRAGLLLGPRAAASIPFLEGTAPKRSPRNWGNRPARATSCLVSRDRRGARPLRVRYLFCPGGAFAAAFRFGAGTCAPAVVRGTATRLEDGRGERLVCAAVAAAKRRARDRLAADIAPEWQRLPWAALTAAVGSFPK